MKLRYYFSSQREAELYNNVSKADLDYILFNLSSKEALIIKADTIDELGTQWTQKAIHGEHLKTLDQHEMDTEEFNIWLKMGVLFQETKGFVIAIQDRVVSAINNRKHVLYQDEIYRCRLCRDINESIEHIIDSFRVIP